MSADSLSPDSEEPEVPGPDRAEPASGDPDPWQAPVWSQRIAGERVAARTGLRFRLHPGSPSGVAQGPFPRAEPDQLESALAGADAAARAWCARDAGERRAILLRAIEAVGEVPAAAGAERFLGLAPHEAAPHRVPYASLAGGSDGSPDGGSGAGWGAALASRVERGAASPPTRGLVLVAPHWTDLARGLGTRLLPELAAGRGALVLSDERLPQPAEAWLEALESAGVEPGLVGLLHGASPELRADAAADSRVAAVRASGSRDELTPLDRAARGHPTGSPWAVELELEPVHARATLVRVNADSPGAVATAARELAAGLWGRGATLSGQLPGGTTRVLCPELWFSAFTEALLEALETAPAGDGEGPVPLVDAAALGAVAGLWELGLDEGATLVSGGERFAAGARRAGDRRVQGTLFTNVEPHMLLAQWRAPAPVLSLLRVPRRVAGAELLERIG